MTPSHLGAAGGALLLALAACAPQRAAPSAGGDARIYEVRGEVVRLPDPAEPMSDLALRHEAIDRFVGMDGEVVGMDSMTMPFPVAPDVPLAGIAVGDKVRFTLRVDWDEEPFYQITRLEKLPAETQLHFGPAAPAGADPDRSNTTDLDQRKRGSDADTES